MENRPDNHVEDYLDIILNVNKSLFSTLETKDLLFLIVQKISEVIPVTRCSIVNVDKDKNAGNVLATFEDPALDSITLDLDKYPEITRSVADNNIVYIGDVETDPTLSAKYLTKLNNNDVNLEGNVQFGEDSDHIGVSGDYYLDRTLSVGASFDLDTVDGADDDYSFGVNARKFIAPNISVQGGVNVGKASDNDNFGLAVGGTYRF